MSNVILRNSIYALLGLAALLWLALAYIRGLNLADPIAFFGLLPQVAFIDLIIAAAFVKWGWRHPIFQGWLVPFPDLTGTWIGEICSDYEPEPGKRLTPIPTMLTITQNFFQVSCVMHTGEMKSRSYSEGFQVDHDRQLKQLSYIYTSKPDLPHADRSRPHDGTAVFDIINDGETRRLEGRYWTERKTTGEINLTFSRTEILDRLPDDLLSHPMSANG